MMDRPNVSRLPIRYLSFLTDAVKERQGTIEHLLFLYLGVQKKPLFIGSGLVMKAIPCPPGT